MTHKEQVLAIFDELKDLYIRKNNNYGDSVSKVPALATDVSPEKAIRVRLSDKFSRLLTLLNGEPDKVGESIEDTMTDIAVYIINWLAAKRMEVQEKE